MELRIETLRRKVTKNLSPRRVAVSFIWVSPTVDGKTGVLSDPGRLGLLKSRFIVEQRCFSKLSGWETLSFMICFNT